MRPGKTPKKSKPQRGRGRGRTDGKRTGRHSRDEKSPEQINRPQGQPLGRGTADGAPAKQDQGGTGSRRHTAGRGRQAGDAAPQVARQGKRHRPPRESGDILLFGLHAVEAALANPQRQIKRLRVTEGAAGKLAQAIQARGIAPDLANPRDLDHILGPDQVHQGALLNTADLPEPALEDLADRAAAEGPVLILDQVTDPHNVGAIIRSAAVFGAVGLVMTRRNSPPLAGTLAKSASGGLEHLPITLVPNLARAIRDLKDCGLTVIGLDGEGKEALEARQFVGPTALVLGAEGAGLRRLTRENCDMLCRITAHGALKSLNVSNAAAVALSWLTARTGRASTANN